MYTFRSLGLTQLLKENCRFTPQMNRTWSPSCLGMENKTLIPVLEYESTETGTQQVLSVVTVGMQTGGISTQEVVPQRRAIKLNHSGWELQGRSHLNQAAWKGRLPKVAKPVLPDATESTLQYNTTVLCNTIKTGATQSLRQQWPPAKQAMPAAQGPKPQCQSQTPDPHLPLAWAISFT